MLKNGLDGESVISGLESANLNHSVSAVVALTNTNYCWSVSSCRKRL